ncbi:MAG: galactokinase [Desulfobacterales bacterium]|nr:galactokinase [Desulfobacterales bacterium]
MNFKPILDSNLIKTSVPCRVDFGGTLDISTFYLPLSHLEPATLNLALDMRTYVTLSPWKKGRIKISSKGFESMERGREESGVDNPMGLMFAIAGYFNAHGVHIHIESTSPPRSALGGSSSAAVAVIAAFYAAMDEVKEPEHIAWLAHYIESSVAGIPCGGQDQTAAAFGGVNLWEWGFGDEGPRFTRKPLYEDEEERQMLNQRILVAYCGIPHESKDINGQWVAAFKSGKAVHHFKEIVAITKKFSSALQAKNFSFAGELMNRETEIRCEITPEVLDKTGKKLFERAKAVQCGARFTGAGGGGCLWAVGEQENIQALSGSWQKVLDTVENGRILDTSIDPKGILIHR